MPDNDTPSLINPTSAISLLDDIRFSVANGILKESKGSLNKVNNFIDAVLNNRTYGISRLNDLYSDLKKRAGNLSIIEYAATKSTDKSPTTFKVIKELICNTYSFNDHHPALDNTVALVQVAAIIYEKAKEADARANTYKARVTDRFYQELRDLGTVENMVFNSDYPPSSTESLSNEAEKFMSAAFNAVGMKESIYDTVVFEPNGEYIAATDVLTDMTQVAQHMCQDHETVDDTVEVVAAVVDTLQSQSSNSPSLSSLKSAVATVSGMTPDQLSPHMDRARAEMDKEEGRDHSDHNDERK